jgi:tetratricopeptide (TPR) repeat protein
MIEGNIHERWLGGIHGKRPGRCGAGGFRYGVVGAFAAILLAAVPVSGAAGKHPAPGKRKPAASKTKQSGDEILVDCKRGLDFLRAGDFAAATEALDRALPLINAGVSGTTDARKARGLFNRESVKAFLGEPYERVMANYYRGVLYWQAGETENARACFRTAQIHDASNESSNRCDFVTLDYLDGLASAMTGDTGEGPMALARASRDKWALEYELPDYHAKANVLVFLETGHGPTKVSEGEHRERLGYQPGDSPVAAIAVEVGGHVVATPAWDSLSKQAMTRGGREMDQILSNKADAKENTDAVGDAALAAGLITAAAGGDGRVAGGLAALGALSKLSSMAMKPEADTRCWDTLPETLAFAAFEATDGERSVRIKFLGRDGGVLAEKELEIPGKEPGKPAVLFVHYQ